MSSVDFSRYKRFVQGFFDLEPSVDSPSHSPIWCLGVQYDCERPLYRDSDSVSKDDVAPEKVNGVPLDKVNWQEEQSQTLNGLSNGNASDTNKETIESIDIHQGWPAAFLDDCESKFWLTYRSHFEPIMKSADAAMTLSVRLRNLTEHGFTSDTGWGCMIRSGQSVLANALSVLQLGREWRRRTLQGDERRLLSLFADDPRAPFSIHRFVEHGAQACGKHPGEWFGPSATARCIQALANDYQAVGLKVYVNGDGADVYEDRVFAIAKSESKTFTPVLILLGVRLGIDRVTPAYWDALKDSLELPQSIGIAGGRPSSSHYFFAHQEDQIFYLDPHFTRPALPFHPNSADYTEKEVDSCHTRRLRRLNITDMDPSMLLAFLIKDEDDWSSWRQSLERSSSKPVVHIADSEPPFHGSGDERQSAVDEVETIDEEEDAVG